MRQRKRLEAVAPGLIALGFAAFAAQSIASDEPYYEHTPPVITIPAEPATVAAPGPVLDPDQVERAAVAATSIPMNTDSSEAFVLPDVSTPIKVSNRDVNRVHCNGVIEDVVFSNEKPMSVTPSKNGNVFVKFLVKRQGEREVAASGAADLHVVCNGQVYTMILYPKPSDSVTIYLGSNKATALKEVLSEWGALPLEERVRRVTLAMYVEQMPSGFQRSPARGDRRDIRMYDGMSIQGVYELRAPGLGLNATEYRVVSTRPLTLNERDFLLPELGNVVGITVDPLVLTPDNKVARLIVVERAAANGN